jgi:DNA polymerase III subunit delta
MLGARESGVRIVAMLARHLRQLWITSELLERTRDKFEIASALGIPPFFADDIIRQARTLDGERAKRMHAALFEADKKLKSSRLEDARLLEALILDLTTSAPSRNRA